MPLTPNIRSPDVLVRRPAIDAKNGVELKIALLNNEDFGYTQFMYLHNYI